MFKFLIHIIVKIHFSSDSIKNCIELFLNSLVSTGGTAQSNARRHLQMEKGMASGNKAKPSSSDMKVDIIN